MRSKPIPGDVVRLTGDFLRNTGQVAGGEGLSRWTVQACECGLCRHGPYILTNQQMSDGSGLRHLHYGNVERVRAKAAPRA